MSFDGYSSSQRPDEPDRDEQKPMLDLAKRCKDLFQQAIAFFEEENENDVSKQLLGDMDARFASWAAYLGVFASSKANLDQRLKRNPAYRDLVILALDMLYLNLIQLLPPDDESYDESDSDSSNSSAGGLISIALDGIHSSLGQLDQLAISIRQSSSSTLASRIKVFAAKRKEEILLFEIKAYLAVAALYPDTLDGLRHRLAKSMTDRCARLLYWESHNKKLQANQDDRSRSHQQLTEIAADPEPDVSLDATATSPPVRLDVDEPCTRVQRAHSMAPSETVPSTMVSRMLPAESRERHSPKSTRGGASSVQISRLQYPKPPKAKGFGALALCPFCHKMHELNEYEDTRWWRQHVDADLQPYACLSDSCENSPSFSKYADWILHMITEHDDNWSQLIYERLPWKCVQGDGVHKDVVLFSGEHELKQHLKAVHGEASAKDLDPDDSLVRPLDLCPFCCLPLEKTESQAKGASKLVTHQEANAEIRGGEENTKKKSVRFADDQSTEGNDMISDAGKNAALKHRHARMHRHIASHLQFLAFLTLRLLPGGLPDGEYQEFHSSSGLTESGGTGGRSTLEDSIVETDTEEHEDGDTEPVTQSDTSPPQTEAIIDDSVYLSDGAELREWKALHHNLKSDDNFAIEHMSKIYGLFETMEMQVSISSPTYDISSLRQALEYAEVKNDSNITESFIPEDRQDAIITHDAVRNFFNIAVKSFQIRWDSDEDAVVKYCTDQICNTRLFNDPESRKDKIASRKKIFAILTLVKKPIAIVSFIRRGISDLDLPISVFPHGSAGSEINSDYSECFSSWNDADIKEFVHHQRKFRRINAPQAPVFPQTDAMSMEPASTIEQTTPQADGTAGIAGKPSIGGRSAVKAIAWSRDMTRLAAASYNTITIWSLLTSACLVTHEHHTLSEISSLSWSPDGSLLVALYAPHTIRLWLVTDGHLILQPTSGIDQAWSVDWTPKGFLATASPNCAFKLWDVATGHCMLTLESHKGEASSLVACSPTGYIASVSFGNTIEILDERKGLRLHTLKGHSEKVCSVAWSDDDRLASASFDKTIKIWNALSGICVSTFPVGRVMHHLQFDLREPGYLYTDIGTLHLLSDVNNVQYRGFGLAPDRTWITRELERLLWIPPAYESSVSFVLGELIIIGCISGQVLMFKCSEAGLL